MVWFTGCQNVVRTTRNLYSRPDTCLPPFALQAAEGRQVSVARYGVGGEVFTAEAHGKSWGKEWNGFDFYKKNIRQDLQDL